MADLSASGGQTMDDNGRSQARGSPRRLDALVWLFCIFPHIDNFGNDELAVILIEMPDAKSSVRAQVASEMRIYIKASWTKLAIPE
jgi:hypothetical protein